MSAANVLIVDDEADIRRLVEITLGRMGMQTSAAGDVESAKELLSEGGFDVCLTDMQLPDGTGLDLVKHVQATQPNLPIAVITAYGNQSLAVESLKAGAFDFVSKPVDIDKLRKLVETAAQLAPEAATAQADKRNTTPAETGPKLLGDTAPMRKLRDTIAKLARSQAPVYINGESGTGKELVARAIHAQGPRVKAAFVPVNCGAIPSELMESEFFGHKKGAFTGATQDKIGLFQSAEGGTLFLDEVADLPMPMQVKLLRAIQERAVRAVGDDTEHAVDVRIICATHKSLEALVRTGEFRQDLFYRLNVIKVLVPPLRERRSDLPLLADHALQGITERHGLAEAPTLTADAIALLQGHRFSGNVRELENVLERAVTLADSNEIDTDDLHLDNSAALNPLQPDAEPPSDPGEPNPRNGPAGSDKLHDQIENLERQRIAEALEQTRYNKTKAAELLGMSFRQLRYRIKKLGID